MMSDDQLAEFMMLTLCEAVGEKVEKMREDWKKMPEADRKPFIVTAQKIRAKILEENKNAV